MKIARVLFIFALFSLFSVSCIQEEADECITALDCPDGFMCLDGMCFPPESLVDNNSTGDNSTFPDSTAKNDAVNTSDSDEGSISDDSDILTETDSDIQVNPNDDDNDEIPDDGAVCTPDTCSGFGTCEVVDGKAVCTCDEFHKGDDCSDCVPGYHMETDDDDENGDGKFSCVKNVACTPDPCNGGGCEDKDMTVTCTCLSGYTGRWCTECDTGYLKSTVDQKCKPDCDNYDYECSGSETCGVDPIKNEAGCVCAEYYSGSGCTTCDGAHFCNSHGTCSAPSGAPICSCTGNWTGNDCSTCADNYIPYNNMCVEDCDPSCGQPGGFINQESHGECVYTSGSGVCQCDAGWKDPIVMFLPMVPECSECNKSSPPPEYSTNGCPTSCKTDNVYDLCGDHGDCYYEKTGSNKRYCLCDGGYHLDNGDPYSGTCVQ